MKNLLKELDEKNFDEKNKLQNYRVSYEEERIFH